MNRKVMKVVSVVLLVMMLLAMLSTSAFAITAGDWSDLNPTDAFKDVQEDKSGLVSSTTNIVGNAITVIQVVGMGIAIIMLIYMAVKYISAAPSEKAEFKKSATAYIVGAIVLFAASGILGIIKNFASNNIGPADAKVEVVDIDIA